MITVSAEQYDELYSSMQEVMELTGKPTMNKRDEARHAALLSKISVLKLGMSPGEFRNLQIDRISREMGLSVAPRIKRRMPEQATREWRNFASPDVQRTFMPTDSELRANEAGQQTVNWTQGAIGGYFAAPSGLYDRAIEVMKQYDEIFDEQNHAACPTKTGTVLQIAAFDDTQNASVQVGETVASTETDINSFATLNLNAYTFRSGMVVASLELLQDANWDWPTFMERAFASRHARGVGKALVTGSGVSAPSGLLTAIVASGASPVVAAGSAPNDGSAATAENSLGSQDLESCYAKLNWQYRRSAIWGMADATLNSLLNLLDKSGRPLVHTFIDPAVGVERYLIFGRPVAIMPSMPGVGPAQNPVVLYDPNYFFVRTVPSAMYIQQFRQAINLITNGLVGFQSFMRVDSGLIAPDTNNLPCAYIQSHS